METAENCPELLRGIYMDINGYPSFLKIIRLDRTLAKAPKARK